MVGQGVLRECLLDDQVALVQSIGRSASGIAHAKFREIIHSDLTEYTPIEEALAGFDACFFCLGVASAGMSEPEYTQITYEITLAAAKTLCRLNPQMTFVFVSGAGTDSSERGRVMWARVKGKTENALQRLPFRGVYAFRPGFIQPLHGARSRTASYRWFYTVAKPVLPPLRWMFPNQILTTVEIGQAMLAAARQGAPKKILESRDIHELALKYARRSV